MIRSCPACGRPTPQRVRFRKWGYDISRCDRCGLGAAVVPDGFDPSTIYSTEYFDGRQKDGYADYGGSEAVLRTEFHGLLRSMASWVPPGAKLLEIGCAYGFFLSEARVSYQVYGIEVSEHAAAFACSRGLDVACGVVSEDLLAGKGPFDVAVMLDVIEHLPRPDETIALLARHLRPGGRLLITTGDWNAALSRLTGPAWRLLTPPQHLFYFTETSLTALLARCGFSVERCTRPWKRVPLSLLLFQLGRMLRLRPKVVPILNRLSIPINLFDAMRLVAVKIPAAAPQTD